MVFCRGIEVSVEFDEQKYIGTGVFLFASVLERFLGLYASINSFRSVGRKAQAKGGVFQEMATASRGAIPSVTLESSAPYRAGQAPPWQMTRPLRPVPQAVRTAFLAGTPFSPSPIRLISFKPCASCAAWCRPTIPKGSCPREGEVARFRAHVSLGFPPSAILRPRAGQRTRPSRLPWTVSLPGLDGAERGFLPVHYTELLIRQQRGDLGHEQFCLARLAGPVQPPPDGNFFYHAWAKYRFWIAYEEGQARSWAA